MGDDLFLGDEGILRGLKPGLLRFCNDQGSRFISAQGRLAFDSPTVLVNEQTVHLILAQGTYRFATHEDRSVKRVRVQLLGLVHRDFPSGDVCVGTSPSRTPASAPNIRSWSAVCRSALGINDEDNLVGVLANGEYP